MVLQRNSVDEVDLSQCGFETPEYYEFDLDLKADPSGISIEEMQNKEDLVSRLKARMKVMGGELKELPKTQSRVIRLYLSSNYHGSVLCCLYISGRFKFLFEVMIQNSYVS